MGSSEDGESSKSEKSSPPATTGTEQGNVQVYPDWAAMQAYYGPRMAMPPYYNQTVASGHLPHPYMWGPQPMMSPYGVPYAAVYANGVYAHTAVPMGTSTHGQAAVTEALAGTPLSIDAPAKSHGNTDKGLMKRLKGFDGLAMSIGNDYTDAKVEGSAENKLSQSADTEGSSDGSDGNTEEADKKKRKRSQRGTPSDGDDEQAESKPPPLATSKVLGIPLNPANTATEHVMGTVAPPSVHTALELLNPAIDVKVNSTTVSSSNTVVSSEVWIRNEREMKRERRKQSNRESARRSRLRKQAEAEELGKKVDALNTENFALRLEISQLKNTSAELRLENATLLEKLTSLQSEEQETSVDIKLNPTESTKNLLSRVKNSGSVSKLSEEGTELCEKSSKSSNSKFHQLLSAKPRADAVAAG